VLRGVALMGSRPDKMMSPVVRMAQKALTNPYSTSSVGPLLRLHRTSLIYASFTFIFFALEAAIMAYAWTWPSTFHRRGATYLRARRRAARDARRDCDQQAAGVTQPLWIFLLVVPYVFVFQKNPGVLKELTGYAGPAGGRTLQRGDVRRGHDGGHRTHHANGRTGRLFAIHARAHGEESVSLVGGVMIGGPVGGAGVLKMLGGALLAYLAISHSVPVDRAVDPNQMYLAAYEYVFPRATWAIAATALLVVVSQLKINVTQRLRRLARVVELLRAAHAQPPGSCGVGHLQHAHRLDC